MNNTSWVVRYYPKSFDNMDNDRHLENRYDVIFPQCIWTKFGSLMQNNTPIMVKWSKTKPEVEFQYGGRLFFSNRK